MRLGFAVGLLVLAGGGERTCGSGACGRGVPHDPPTSTAPSAAAAVDASAATGADASARFIPASDADRAAHAPYRDALARGAE